MNIYIYIYYFLCNFKRILKFSNIISYAISIIIGEHHFFSYDWKYGFYF